MSENAYQAAGIIELTPCIAARRPWVDDSTLERLLTSFAGFDSLAEHLEVAEPEAADAGEFVEEPRGPRWNRLGGAVCDGRMSVTADLGILLRELEREYERVCSDRLQ